MSNPFNILDWLEVEDEDVKNQEDDLNYQREYSILLSRQTDG